MTQAKLVTNKKLLHPELSYKINGILFKVRKELGIFKNEKQYCDAIEKLLQNEKILYEREKVILSSFDGERDGRSKVDFLVEKLIILEIKAKPFVTKNDYYQTLRYLEALNCELALLVNMRRYYINPKRILNSKSRSDNSDKSS